MILREGFIKLTIEISTVWLKIDSKIRVLITSVSGLFIAYFLLHPTWFAFEWLREKTDNEVKIILYLLILLLFLFACGFATVNNQFIVELITKTITDRLTGLPNRWQFMEESRRIVARAKRENSYLAIIFMDLKKFKAVNDNFGLVAGDEALICFSSLLKDVIREEDLAARYAGDEFLVILDGPSEDVLMSMYERIKARLSNVSFSFVDYRDNSHLISFSAHIGIQIGPAREKGILQRLIAEADEAMRKSKRR